MRVGVTTEVVWTILTSWDPSCLLRAFVMPDNDGPTAQLHASRYVYDEPGVSSILARPCRSRGKTSADLQSHDMC